MMNIRSKDLDFKVIERASELMYEKFRIDESFPDLSDQFARRLDQPGSHNYFVNYKNLFGSMVNHNKFVKFPKKIEQALSNVEITYFMGILAEIDRVWIAIDNILYIWNCKNPEDYEVYDGFSEILVSVSLSTPKPGVFVDAIKYVLVVSTAVEVVLLGLSFESNTFDDLRIIPTSYIVSSDNVSMLKVIGSQAGRIFMNGDDGNFYELDYDNIESSWSSVLGFESKRKCQKINHYKWHWRLVSFLPSLVRNISGLVDDVLVDICVDNVRRFLYTATSKGFLTVFYLGSNFQETICIVYRYDLFDAIRRFVNERIYLESAIQANELKDFNNVNVISLHVIPITESTKVQLIIILSTGVRVYMKLNDKSHSAISSVDDLQPSGIEVAFIRSPPSLNAIHCSQERVPLENDMEGGCLPSYSPTQLLNIKNAYYCQGIFLVSLSNEIVPSSVPLPTLSAIGSHDDKLLCIHEDLMSHSFTPDVLLNSQIPNLREAVSLLTSPNGNNVIHGKIYDIQEKDQTITSLLLNNSIIAKLNTLFSTSSSSLSASIIYHSEKESDKFANCELFSNNSMVKTLPSSYIPATLQPQGKSTSWGYGKKSTTISVIRHEFLNSHIPILSRNQSQQRTFLCLTNNGIHVVTKMSPADVLMKLLSTVSLNISSTFSSNQLSQKAMQQSQEYDESYNELKLFFDRFGAIQSSTICLGIACGLPTHLSLHNSNCTNGHSYDHLSSNSSTDLHNIIATRAIHVMQQFSKVYSRSSTLESARTTSVTSSLLGADPRLNVHTPLTSYANFDYVTSPELDALYLFTSRILRPFWLRAVVGSDGVAECIDITSITWMKTILQRLQTYFQQYHPLVIGRDPVIDITLGASLSGASNNGTIMDYLFNESRPGNKSDLQSVDRTSNPKSSRLGDNPNASPEIRQLQFHAKNLEDSSLNALYRLISRTIQALDLLTYLHDLHYNRQLPLNPLNSYSAVNWGILSGFTLKSWVISPNVHEFLKKVIRDVLHYFSSISATNVSVMSYSSFSGIAKSTSYDFQNLIQEFIENISTNCYYYFSAGDRYAYDALKEEEIIRSLLPTVIGSGSGLGFGQSFGMGTNGSNLDLLNSHMKACVDLWINAVKDWTSPEFVLSGTPSGGKSTEETELNRICSTLSNLGGYCCGAIVDICLTAAKNFHSSQSSVSPYSSASDVDWDHEIYHGRPMLTDSVLDQAKKACYTCLIKQIINLASTETFSQSGTSAHTSNSTSIELKVQAINLINKSMSQCTDAIYQDMLLEALYKDSPKHLIEIVSTNKVQTFLKNKDPLLLYRHFEYHHEYIKSAELMASLACNENTSLKIAVRIDHLRSAVLSASAAFGSQSSLGSITKSSIQFSAEKPSVFTAGGVQGYQDLLDVACLQQLACDRLTSPPLSIIYTAQKYPIIPNQLETKLLTITDLFNLIAVPFKLWDICLQLMQMAHYEDSILIERFWKSLIYRIIPTKATTDIADSFLNSKRRPENIDIDPHAVEANIASYNCYGIVLPTSTGELTVENHVEWRHQLSQFIVKLSKPLQFVMNTALTPFSSGDSLHASISDSLQANSQSQDRNNYFPLSLIIEEIELFATMLTSVNAPLPRGWLVTDCLRQIACLNTSWGGNSAYESSSRVDVLIIDSYMHFFDKWIGKTADKLIQILSTVTLILKLWLLKESNMQGLDTSEHIQLVYQVIRSGLMRRWTDKLRKQVNTLIGKSSLYTDELFEEIVKDVDTINRRVESITYM